MVTAQIDYLFPGYNHCYCYYRRILALLGVYMYTYLYSVLKALFLILFFYSTAA